MILPKICPNCGVDLENDAMYFARGIQYCTGFVTDIETNPDEGEEPMLEVDMSDAESYWVDPYEIQCGECNHIVWRRHLIVNEEKFFIEEGD